MEVTVLDLGVVVLMLKVLKQPLILFIVQQALLLTLQHVEAAIQTRKQHFQMA